MEININKKRLNRKDIIILIPPWKAPKLIYKKIKKMIPENFGYIDYRYSKDILNADPWLTKKYFLKLMNKIIFDLNTLNKKIKRNYYIYAQSLGGVFGAYLLDKIDIKKGVFIVPGDNLAECVWNGTETNYLKKEMQKNGMTLKKLKIIWKGISQDSHFKGKAKNTKYFIKLSIKDTVVPYENGLKLIKIFKKRKFEFELHEGILPHNETCLYECLFPKKAIDFLTKEN